MEIAAYVARDVHEMRSPAQARLRSCAVRAPSCKRLWPSSRSRVRTSSREQRRVACRSRRASAGSPSRR